MADGGEHQRSTATTPDAAAPIPAIDAAFDWHVAGHALRFLPGGPDRLDLILRLIADAQCDLRMLFYIFAADRAGAQVRDALVAAAARGVRVTLILDSFGSATTPDSFFAPLRAAGGRLFWFSTRWSSRYLIRNHQKLLVADSARLMIGGFNIEDSYFGPPGSANGWRDLGIGIDGPDAAVMADWFDRLADWVAQPRPRWIELRRIIRRWGGGDGAMQWLVGGPTALLSPWARAIKRDLERADRLTMIMAYFAPGQSMLRRLGRIGRRGSARLVLAARSDNGATIGAARALYIFLLKRHVAIAEYVPERLHLKLIVIDDVVYLGSANFDLRSLFVNLELMLRIKDAGLAARLTAYADAHLPLSTPVTLTSHRARAGWFTRLRWALSWFIVTAVDYGVTRRLNLGLRGE